MHLVIASLLFISLAGHAQDDLTFEDIENANSMDMFNDMEVIDALTDQRDAVEKARVRVLRPPPLPKPESRPAAFRAVIPNGTVITRLSDDKDFSTSRRIQVWAQEIAPGSQTTHILDKDKNPVFSARSIHVVPIEEDLALTPNINPKITYDKTVGLKYSAFESRLNLISDFAWEFESVAPNFWNQVFQQDMDSGSSSRISGKLYYDGTILPIDFGLGVSYQEANAFSDNFEIKWDALYIGPQVRYTAWQGQEWQIDLEAGAAAALISNARTQLHQYSPSSYEWNLAAKGSWDTWLGKVLAGVEYRRAHISLDQVTEETVLVSDKEAQTSTSFLIGYRIGFSL